METKNKIKVIIPFFNPGDFLDMCISSVLTQDYDNYEVLFIDDCSTDGSFNKIPGCIFKTDENNQPIRDENGEMIILEKHPLLEKTKCQNVVAWKASERATALPNIHNGIMKFATNEDDIVVLLDGDDWLYGKGTLSYINDFYNKNSDCWMMYGSSKWTDGRKCCSSSYPEFEFKNLRAAPFRVSHIRTFRAGLYHKIEEQDPGFTCMRNSNGEWYTMTYDVAMFLPMLEMAGFSHVKHNVKPLYVYNRDNPISDDKVNQQKQWDIHEEILKKKRFAQIDSYKKKEHKTLVYCGVNNGDGLVSLMPFYDSIYAFDANSDKIEICKRRFGHENKVKFINAALHETDNEEIKFYITEKWDAASSIGKLNENYFHVLSKTSPLYEANIKNLKEIKVRTINLGNFLKKEGVEQIDYLLTDLQGYDFSVLKTVSDFIEKKKIKNITCEVEENNSEQVYVGIPSNKKKLFDRLLEKNYTQTEDRNDSDGWTFDCTWKLK